MSKSNWAVGEAYKMNTARDPRKRNIHDPHDMYVWTDNKPWWLTPLQVLGFVATGAGLTLILFLL